jgi:hypothetical protein
MKDHEPEEKQILLIESMRLTSGSDMRPAHGTYPASGRRGVRTLTEAASPGYVQDSL